MVRRLSAILAADVVGYSRLMGVDEAGTLAALTAHRDELISPKTAEHDGRIVKLMGDGILVEFPSVIEAVQCAVEIQTGMAERNAGVSDDRRIQFRIGVNLGDVIVEGDDIYGEGVNVAARLETLAAANGICVSDMVYQGVDGKLDIAFEDLGERVVKNIAKPVHVYRVAHGDGAGASGDARVRTSKPSRRWVIGVGVLAFLAAGSLAAWVAFDPWRSTPSEAGCTDHLGLPLPEDRCPDLQE